MSFLIALGVLLGVRRGRNTNFAVFVLVHAVSYVSFGGELGLFDMGPWEEGLNVLSPLADEGAFADRSKGEAWAQRSNGRG